MYMYVYIYIYVCIYVCMYVYVYVGVCVYTYFSLSFDNLKCMFLFYCIDSVLCGTCL